MSKFRSLKKRIYINSGLLVLLCVLGNLLGWVGQQFLLQNFAANEQTDQTAADMLQVDRMAQELKFRAENYVQTGAAPQYDLAMAVKSDLIEDIATVQRELADSELSEILQQMHEHIEVFGTQLALASKERQVRREVSQVQLPPVENKVDQAFVNLERALENAANQQVNDRLFVAVQAFALARKHMLRYLIEPSTRESKAMSRALRECQQQIGLIELQTDVEATAHTALAEALQEFQILSSRAVLATRGYLYYTNVVMAGEISEFVYYSNKLKLLVSEMQVINREKRTVASRNARLVGIVTSLISVVLAAGLAVNLSYVIFHPISELTETFFKLSAGGTVDSIPAASRPDEIGRMASAAEVFSRKNAETKELLVRSQTLSQELATKAQALEETNNELDNFAYVASHDLKSPLRGLHSLADWVQEDCSELLPEESRTHLQLMQSRVRKMEMLLNDLLDYSRVGRQHQIPERVDLDATLKSVLELTDNPTGVQVVFRNRLPVLHTLKVPLQQVLLNLITNAIKYNDKSAHGRVEISCQDKGEFYQLSVADNGIGIEPQFHDRVFQMYQRVAVDKADGTGMGLAIVKKQIEQHGGELTLESAGGDGATFTFTWPKHMPTPIAPDSSERSSQSHTPVMA